jgi:CTP:molybdopterin cytidylyltransferase MocA
MIAGLVLAAGDGTRFGSDSKLLADLNGRRLLEYAIDAQCAVIELERIVVVLGAAADEVRTAVDLGRAEAVVCADWADGQSASLKRGVEALAQAHKVIVTLGDVPLITPAAIRRFLDPPTPARATYDGRPGHPVVLGPQQLEAVRGLSGDQGARGLLSGAKLIECSDVAGGLDVDTPADLEAASAALRSS